MRNKKNVVEMKEMTRGRSKRSVAGGRDRHRRAVPHGYEVRMRERS
jgi:hypothetical protein